MHNDWKLLQNKRLINILRKIYILSEEIKPRHRSHCHEHPHWQSRKKSAFRMLWKTRICLQVKTARQIIIESLKGSCISIWSSWRGNELLRWNLIGSREGLYDMAACDRTEADRGTQQIAQLLSTQVQFLFWGWKNKTHKIVRIVEIGPFCKLNFTVIFAAVMPLLLGERMWKGK